MAGLGRKVFTAGDVLTASDVQNYMMDQSVMNFAGTAARSSAIATPTDGMVTYNQATDSIEAYNGTAWIGMSGMQLVKKQDVGTAVSSVTITSCFNSTYNSYRIIYTNGVGSANADIYATLSGISTGYYSNMIYGTYTTTTVTAVAFSNVSTMNYVGGMTASGANMDIEIHNPNLAKAKWGKSSFVQMQAGGNPGNVNHWINSTTQSTGITFTTASGTLTGGTIYVYGYSI